MPSNITSAPFNWRDHLQVHPAADLFPLLSEAELKELADDIRKNGLQQPIILSSELLFDEVNKRTGDLVSYLVDGRNRLDALALLGWLKPATSRKNRGFESGDIFVKIEPFELNLKARPTTLTMSDKWHPLERRHFDEPPDDVYSFVLSVNVHRRHLTAEKKRELIAKLLKRQPEISDRQIGDTVNADHKTVASVRSEIEGRGEIPHVETRTDSKGRKQPSSKPKSDDLLKRINDDQDAWLAANPGKTLSDGFWLTVPRTDEQRAAGLPPQVEPRSAQEICADINGATKGIIESGIEAIRVVGALASTFTDEFLDDAAASNELRAEIRWAADEWTKLADNLDKIALTHSTVDSEAA